MTALLTLPAVETPHLLLREIEWRDAADLAGFLTQPRYQRHIAHRLKDDAEVSDFVRRQIAAQDDRRRQVFHLAAEEKLSTDVVGEGFIIVHGDGSHELGWGVHPAMWAMGLGTEIGHAMLAIGFERLKSKSMWCKVMAANAASAKLARRMGMKHDAFHTDFPVGQGKLGPVELFRMTAAEYFELPY